jgi:TolA-binding protein
MIQSHGYHNKPGGLLTLPVLAMVLLALSAGCSSVRYSSRADNYLKAKDLFQAGRYEEAAKYYQIYLEEYPNSRLHEVILFRLGQCHRHMNNFAEARSAFQSLIERYQTGFWVEQAQEALSEIP